MILTKQAKKDFNKWIEEQGIFLGLHPNEWREYNIEELSENFQYALIIEWFDSVDIIISVRWEWSTKTFQSSIFSKGNNENVFHLSHSHTRTEITKKAIEKANEIYNQNS